MASSSNGPLFVFGCWCRRDADCPAFPELRWPIESNVVSKAESSSAMRPNGRRCCRGGTAEAIGRLGSALPVFAPEGRPGTGTGSPQARQLNRRPAALSETLYGSKQLGHSTKIGIATIREVVAGITRCRSHFPNLSMGGKVSTIHKFFRFEFWCKRFTRPFGTVT